MVALASHFHLTTKMVREGLYFSVSLRVQARIHGIMFKLNPVLNILFGLLFLVLSSACQKEGSQAITQPKSLVLPTAIDDPNYGAESNPTGDVIGGGFCYSRIVDGEDYLVGTVEGFLAALEQVQAGEIIRIEEDATIDLTGNINLRIPAGVTLAGNRGDCFTTGPLLINNDMTPGSVWFWVDEGVRITGLRFQGPDDLFKDINYDLRPAKSSICFAVGEADVEIDNCEIFKFSRGAIEIYPDGRNVYIHHNFLHDVHAYPVITLNRSGLPILIEANLIYWVWHATAGSGYPGTGYEARYNIMIRQAIPTSWLPYGGDHAVDMHPYLDVLVERGQRIAGDELSIHHNTFLNSAENDPSVNNSPDAFVRGTPRTLAQFYNNRFLNASPDKAINHFDGNTWVYNNKYGPEETLIPIATETTPQIIFHSPPPPDITPSFINTTSFAVDININTLSSLSVQSVTISLNNDIIYEGASAPAPNSLIIDFCQLNNQVNYHKLLVTATDNRGVTGQHMTIFRGTCGTN